MSATNTTTNYNLPIFIETDKPAWLVDFNGAMRAIDAQMKTNADAIATKSPILTFNDTSDIDFTNTDNVITANLASAVSDKVGRALVTPVAAPASDQIVSINTSGQQAALEIGSGLIIDNGILNAIDLNLETMVPITSMRSVTGSPTSTTYNLNCAFNSDRSIGKIYGTIQAQKNSAGSYEFYSGVYVPNPTGASYNITPCGIAALNPTNTSYDRISNTTITIESDGEIVFKFATAQGGTAIGRWFPFIIFLKNFGDVE